MIRFFVIGKALSAQSAAHLPKFSVIQFEVQNTLFV